MKNFISFIIILFITNISFGQHILSGSIKDARNKEPLMGVSIYIPATKQGTVSDLDGKFVLKHIPKSKIEVIFSYQGYQTVHRNIQFEQAQKNLQIYMKEAVFEMDEVIVSTGINKLQKDNVMKVAHQNIAALERKGMQNIMEGIAQIPGVSNLSTGTGIAKPVIRGLSGNRVLVYNQGVRLENYQFGEEHGMGVDASGIAGVEVIKGPASLLYGSDALGGVVYLIPEKYAPAHSFHAGMQSKYFSNTRGTHQSLGLKTSEQKWQFLARGAFKINGDYRIPNGDLVLNSANKDKDFKMGVGYKDAKWSADLRYNYNHTLNGMAEGTGFEDKPYAFSGTYQNLHTNNLSLKNSWELGESKLKTNIGFSQFERALLKDGQDFIDMQLRTINTNVLWYLPERHNFQWILGGEAYWQHNTNIGPHILLPNAQTNNLGLFSTLNYTHNNTALQGGLRYDYRTIDAAYISNSRPGLKRNLGSFTGSLGVKQDWHDNWQVRLNFASGFRAPNLAELTSNGEHEGRVEIGDRDLKNEQNFQTDFNLDYNSSHFTFFVNTFYNKIHHYIYLAPLGYQQNNLAVYAYKQNDAKLYGGETGVHFHPHPWDWLHISSSFETVIAQTSNGGNLPLIPADQWKNELQINHRYSKGAIKKIYGGVQINHTFASRPDEEEDVYPAYTLLNTNFGMAFKYKKMHGEFNLVVHNLTDRTYISNLSVLREDKIPNQGRNFIIGLKLIL